MIRATSRVSVTVDASTLSAEICSAIRPVSLASAVMAEAIFVCASVALRTSRARARA